MRMGAATRKTPGGKTESRKAPMTPPTSAAPEKRSTRPTDPESSLRYPTAPLTEPGTSPTLFATFAATGGSPAHRRTGKVMRVPEPTTVLIAPAPIPATTTTTPSTHVTAPSRPDPDVYPPTGPDPAPRHVLYCPVKANFAITG